MSSISLKRALITIALSVFCINGPVYLGIYLYKVSSRKGDAVPIHVIVQTGPQREALQTAYLAQLMGLSADHPKPTGSFDSKAATAALCKSPVIKETRVKLLKPGVVYVDYTVRQPIARLADYENTAFDAEGRLFPLAPFFAPKNLPEVYLGLTQSIDWETPLPAPQLKLATTFLRLLQSDWVPDLCMPRRIDLSQAEHPSLGHREIVLLFEDVLSTKTGRWIFPRYIRLSPSHFKQALGNYLKLRTYLFDQEKKQLPPMKPGQTLLYCPAKVIDLRLPKMGFIANVAPNEHS